jgi:O-antigen/teichoic acid export membrane protein
LKGFLKVMQLDGSDTCDAGGLKRAPRLSALTNRISAIELRFPLASRGLLSICDQAIFSGTSFITAVLIGRATSPDQLGLYYLVMSIILIISGVQEQIVAAPYVVYSKRRQGRELAEYAGSIWGHTIGVVAITMIVVSIAIAGLSFAGQSDIVSGLWALVVATPMLVIRHAVRRFAFAHLDFKSAVALDIAVAFLQLGGLVLVINLGWFTLFTIFAVMGGACALPCVGWYWLTKPSIRFVRERFLPDWHDNWNFGKWALQTYVLGNTTPQLMLWLVSVGVGPAATGMFGACNNLIGISYVILIGIANVLNAQAAQAYAANGVKGLRRVLVLVGSFYALTMGGVCLLILVTGDWLVVFAFGTHYQGTGIILLVLSLSTFMNALSIVAGNGLWAIDQPRSNFLADACCMTVTLIVAALLVHPFGAVGAALATFAGTSAAAVVRLITLMRCLEVHASATAMAINAALPS